MESDRHSRWLTVALVLGYFGSVVAIGAALSGSPVTLVTALLFLLPSLVFGALIARWWAPALPFALGMIAYLTGLATCGSECLDEVISDLKVGLVFVVPPIFAMAVGVILGKLMRRWNRPTAPRA